MPDAFESLPAGALAAPGELSSADDAPDAVDAPDVVVVCFLVVAEEPAGVSLEGWFCLAGWFCFLVVGAVVPSPGPVDTLSPEGVVAGVGWPGVG